MILSHKHKFIFFKPIKSAGSSVEALLSQQCGNEDILTGPDFEDSITYLNTGYREQNNSHIVTLEGQDAINAMVMSGNSHLLTEEIIDVIKVDIRKPVFDIHVSPSEVFSKISGIEDYLKISIARNPFDMMVSFFWWLCDSSANKDILKFKITSNDICPSKNDSASCLQEKFEKFIHKKLEFYEQSELQDTKKILKTVDWLGSKSFDLFSHNIDFILKFENIQNDYDSLCDLLCFKRAALPRLKSNARKHSAHYSEYYNKSSETIVRDKLYFIFEKFNYSTSLS